MTPPDPTSHMTDRMSLSFLLFPRWGSWGGSGRHAVLATKSKLMLLDFPVYTDEFKHVLRLLYKLNAFYILPSLKTNLVLRALLSLAYSETMPYGAVRNQ